MFGTEIKCQQCGAPLKFTEDRIIAKCGYCNFYSTKYQNVPEKDILDLYQITGSSGEEFKESNPTKVLVSVFISVWIIVTITAIALSSFYQMELTKYLVGATVGCGLLVSWFIHGRISEIYLGRTLDSY